MIANRAHRGNDSRSNLRRCFNYLRTELDRFDDLTNMVVDVPRGKLASYKRNDSPHTRAPTSSSVPTEWPTILDIRARRFSPTSQAIELGTSQIVGL
jgi:hypothetical protein